MAISCKYTFEDNGIKKVVYGAYVRFMKGILESSDTERFENTIGIHGEEYDKLVYGKKTEARAYFYVYPSKSSRDALVTPIHTFGVEFEYDENSDKNLISQAYSSLVGIERIEDIKEE